jgi:acetamidase/formamidase
MPIFTAALRSRALHALAAIVFIAATAAVPSRAAEHTLMPSPQTVHIGYFLATVKPVLTIDSGDIVTVETVAPIVPDVVDKAGVVPPSAIPQYQRDIYGQVKDRGPGPHVLTGPIEIKGAEPGDVLEVRILAIDLALDWGYNRQRSYAGALPDEFTALWTRIIPINRQAKTAEVAKGVVVPVDKPFFGTMGLAPDATAGRISSVPPGVHSGNMDNKDLIAGTTLFMPVQTAGALFSVGDAHAAQGHGEVDLMAIETGLRGKFQFIVRKDMKLTWPRAETPTHWIVMGLHPNLEEAMKIAVPEPLPRGGLHDRERRGRLPRDPSRGRHQGHPRHDSEIDLRGAAIGAGIRQAVCQPTVRRFAPRCRRARRAARRRRAPRAAR